MYLLHRKKIDIYANISLFLSYSEVTVATQIQSVSRSDGGSAPRDDLFSPKCQQRPGHLDEPQRPRPGISTIFTPRTGYWLLLKPDLETAASSTDATRTRWRRKRCERGQKRGKRGGIRSRLGANPTRPALPTLMLSNLRSLENKLDLIQLSQSTQHEARDCCVFVFSEIWLNGNIPDSAIQLHGLTYYRADRDPLLSGKTRGGGLCVYINKQWG